MKANASPYAYIVQCKTANYMYLCAYSCKKFLQCLINLVRLVIKGGTVTGFGQSHHHFPRQSHQASILTLLCIHFLSEHSVLKLLCVRHHPYLLQSFARC